MSELIVTWVEFNPHAGTTGFHATYDTHPQGEVEILESEVTDAGEDGTEVVITFRRSA